MNPVTRLFVESKLTQAQAYRIAKKLSDDNKTSTIVLYDDEAKNYVIFRKDDYESLIGSGKLNKEEYQLIKEFEVEEIEETTSETEETETNEETTDLESELSGGEIEEPTPETPPEQLSNEEIINTEEIETPETEETIDMGETEKTSENNEEEFDFSEET